MNLSDADSSAAVTAVVSVLMIALLCASVTGVLLLTASSLWDVRARRMVQPAAPDDQSPS